MADESKAADATPPIPENHPEFTLVRSGRGAGGKLLRVPHGYMTGGMVREFLGINEYQFRSMTQSGQIESQKRNARGWPLYLETDVHALAKNVPGPAVGENGGTSRRERPEYLLPATISSSTVYTNAEAVQVFAMMREGMNLVDVVLRTGLHAAVVKAIARDYVALGGCLYVDAAILARINDLPLDGELPIRRPEDLLKILETAARGSACRTKSCKRPTAGHCANCLGARVLAAHARKAAKASAEPGPGPR